MLQGTQEPNGKLMNYKSNSNNIGDFPYHSIFTLQPEWDILEVYHTESRSIIVLLMWNMDAKYFNHRTGI